MNPTPQIEVSDPSALNDPAVQRELAAFNAALEANPLWGYRPHPKQLAFHSAKVRLRVYFGGNRSGKTAAGVIDDVIQCIDKESVPDHLKRFKRFEPPCSVRIVVPDFGLPLQAIQETIHRWCPAFEFKGASWEEAWSQREHRLRFGNGSFIEVMSYEQDRSKFGGVTRHRCVDKKTRALSRKGWATAEYLTEGDEILTLNTETGAYEWKPITRLFESAEDRMTRLRSRNNFDLLVTGDHRWWVYNKKTKRNYFTTTDELKTTEQLIVGGTSAVDADNPDFSDAEIALVGWLVTDGCISGSNMFIGQSSSYNFAKCEEIEGWLEGFEYRVEERPYGDEKCQGTMRNYHLRGKSRERLLDITGPEKWLPQDFILSLGTRQREILLDAIIKGDGQYLPSGKWTITTSRRQHKEAFLLLASLLGHRAQILKTKYSWSVINGRTAQSKRYDYSRVSVCQLERSEVDEPTAIWCPTTENGTFVAERNGAVFVTGNCHFDEEPDGVKGEEIRQECQWRLAETGGDELFTFTPLNGIGWTFDEFEEQKGPEIEKNVWLNEKMLVVRASVRDNPAIPSAEIDRLVENLPDLVRRAREGGEFLHLEGLVYPMFDKDLHCVNPEWLRSDAGKDHVQRLDLYEVIDPGYNTTAVLFAGFDPENRLLIYDELYLTESASIPENAAERIREKRKAWGVEPKYTLIDPSARNHTLTGAKLNGKMTPDTVEAAYYRAGIRTIRANNDKEGGVFEVMRRLEHRDSEGEPDPLLLIGENCSNLIRETRRYRLKPKDDGSFDVVKREDHGVDCKRYLCNARPLSPAKPRRSSGSINKGWLPGTAPPMSAKKAPEPAGPLGLYT
jgi:hypothetical protein